MNWQLVLTTFMTIFLAELGDKTQIATFAVAANERSPLSVLLGASTALVATSVIAVIVGNQVGNIIPPHWIRRAAGALFIALGVLYLSKG